MANGQALPSQILSVVNSKSLSVFNTSLITAPRLYDYNCSRSTCAFYVFEQFLFVLNSNQWEYCAIAYATITFLAQIHEIILLPACCFSLFWFAFKSSDFPWVFVNNLFINSFVALLVVTEILCTQNVPVFSNTFLFPFAFHSSLDYWVSA